MDLKLHLFIIIFILPFLLHFLFSDRPSEMFVNRLEYDSITVEDAIKLDSNHLVVVYKQLEGKIESRIVRGPTIFIPSAHEWWVEGGEGTKGRGRGEVE